MLRSAHLVHPETLISFDLRSFVGTKKTELLDCISKLVKERLSASQKSLLLEIYSLDEGVSATRFVALKYERGGLSKSALWERLNSLKRMGLVDFGSRQLRGRTLKLTGVGRLLIWLL